MPKFKNQCYANVIRLLLEMVGEAIADYFNGQLLE